MIETIAPQSGYRDPTSAKNQQPTQFYGKGLEMNFEREDVRYQTLEEYPYPEYPYTMPSDAPPHPVAYYYLLGKFNIPSLERLRKELLAETERRFNERLDLTPFEGQYYRLVYPGQEPVINLSINFEDITVDLHYPLETVTENQRSRLPKNLYTRGCRWLVRKDGSSEEKEGRPGKSQAERENRETWEKGPPRRARAGGPAHQPAEGKTAIRHAEAGS